MRQEPSGILEVEEGRVPSRRTIVRWLGGTGILSACLLLGTQGNSLARRLPPDSADPEGKKRFAIKKEILICYQNQTLRVATKAFLKGRYPGGGHGSLSRLSEVCPADQFARDDRSAGAAGT